MKNLDQGFVGGFAPLNDEPDWFLDLEKRIGNKFAFLKNYPHPLLHAKTLGLIHPITKEELTFTVEAPETFQKVLTVGKS